MRRIRRKFRLVFQHLSFTIELGEVFKIPERNYMKKAILILILLILAGGTILFFGWVNIKPGYFGIAHSTLTGTVPYPLESGKIHWFWQKLVPKSFHLYEVDNQPRSLSIESSYPLPGSEQIQEFGTFDLVVDTDLQYRLDFETASSLIELGLFDGFTAHLEGEVTAQVGEEVSSFMLESMIRHSQYKTPVSYDSLDRLKESIRRRIRDIVQHYGLADADWEVAFKEIPQLDLYNDALNRYFAHIESVYRYKEEELDREKIYLARAKENDLEIDRWQKYGELIRKYPELLKYFYIEKFSGQADVLVLPQNESTGFPKMLEPWESFLGEPAPGAETPPPTRVPPVQQESGEKVEPTGEGEKGKIDTGDTLRDDGSETEKKWYDMFMFWKHAGAPN
jgi:hypothetical protein